MKTIRQWFLTLGVSLALNAAAETSATNSFAFKGTVVDASGRPVDGATVESHSFDVFSRLGMEELDSKERVTTASDGAFELKLPRSGVLVIASKPGLAPA